jgi:hypothetical protein
MSVSCAVLLTPSKSSGPGQLLSYKQIAAVNPLESALPDSFVNVANKRLIGLLSPLDSALTKRVGGGPSLLALFFTLFTL